MNKKVSDEDLKKLISKYYNVLDMQKEERLNKQASDAGKELALLYLWMKSSGLSLQVDDELLFADLLKDYPKALKETMNFYNILKDHPSVWKHLLIGLEPAIMEGLLQIHFNWRKIPEGKEKQIAQELEKI